MPDVKIFTVEGKESGTIALSSNLFDGQINLSCVREVLNQYRSNQRRGTANTKTRGETRGGGAKPWRQKGTGRARAGSIRSPLWQGGAVTFGPKPRSYKLKVNKKKKREAYCSVFTSFAREGRVYVFEELVCPEPKTRFVAKLLENIGIEGKTIVIVDESDKNFFLSCRNIPEVKVITVDSVNIYDLLDHDNLVLNKKAVKKLEELMG